MASLLSSALLLYYFLFFLLAQHFPRSLAFYFCCLFEIAIWEAKKILLGVAHLF